jgi:hypothetical protein
MQNLVLRSMRLFGALAILAVGAVHLQRYLGAGYQTIPTIGPLFLVNAIAAGIAGFGLLLPVERVMGDRAARGTVAGLALAAVAIAVGSLVALFISETGKLFGFSESGYGTAIVVAIIAEAATIALLGPVAAVSLARAVSPGRAGTTRPRDGGSRLDYSAAR